MTKRVVNCVGRDRSIFIRPNAKLVVMLAPSI